MKFILEKISPADAFMIATHVEAEFERGNSISFSLAEKILRTWAVDRLSNNYLLKVPAMMREDSERNYYFYFFGNLYKIELIGWLGSAARIAHGPPLSEELKGKFKEDLECAFAAYGEFGTGPLDETGRHSTAIKPNFAEGL